MKAESTNSNDGGYKIDDSIQVKFFQNSKFCLRAQEYIQNLLSVQVAIIPQQLIKNRWSSENVSDVYRIHVLDATENRIEIEQAVSNSIEKLFETMPSQTFTNDKVREWLQYTSTNEENLRCLQKIIDEKVQHLFTVCEEDPEYSLKIYYLSRQLSDVPHVKDLNKIIENKIIQETISLPIPSKYSRRNRNEFEELIDEATEKGDITASFDHNYSKLKQVDRKVILFGYYKTVNQLKEQLLKVAAKCNGTMFKLTLLDKYQTEFLYRNYRTELTDIEKKYDEFGVELYLESNEFLAPTHLKDEIEPCVAQLLSNSKSITFNSKSLPKDIEEIAEKHIKQIAHKYCCPISTQLRTKSQYYTIPKALSSSTSALSVDNFLFSPNVSGKVPIGNASIEIRMGDIALQKADVIVIPMTTNGLKESVIERAGSFQYERTSTTPVGAKFTETNGGKLSCKRILFSNWITLSLINSVSELRKSVQIFVSKSIEYAIQDQSTRSIAFAVSNLCGDEEILAKEMIVSTHQQIQLKKLQLNISFIMLPEQISIHRHFFTFVREAKNGYIHLEWVASSKLNVSTIMSTFILVFRIVIKTTILASIDEDLLRCQNKINNYLKRFTSSSKVTNLNGIFQYWDQQTINKFYQYGHDQCVLPDLNQTEKELKLTGFINKIVEAEQRYNVLSNLATAKYLRMSKIGRSSSVPVNNYNMMLSYCEKDTKRCQQLIKRFTEENLTVWAEPIVDGQLRDSSSQTNKSECILLCISEYYYESHLCEQEARYALQTGKPVLLLKIRNDPLFGWQRELFRDKLFLPLFGSEHYFNLQIDNLLLKILRSIKSKSDRHEIDGDKTEDILAIERRRSKYDEKIRTLMEIGHIKDDEMAVLIEQLQHVKNDTDSKEHALDEQNQEIVTKQQSNNNAEDNSIRRRFEWIERWLKKPTNTTKQNLPPFSVSGDINDVIFPMPEYMLHQLGVNDQSLLSTQAFSMKF
ncbi:hypothetical protein I4U23_003711 [Adineta vaga]|nr:hypothetical protein I4U23_003711 [Adineta vaga]